MKYEDNADLRGLIRAIGTYLGKNCEYGALDELMSDIGRDMMKAYLLAETKTHVCAICGQEMATGITIWPYGYGFAHPECVQGKKLGKHIPIDHGD